MWIIENYGLLGLFFLCFLAATLLPFSSELIFLAFLHQSTESDYLIWAVASAGNSLGGLTTYLVGAWGNVWWRRRFSSTKDRFKLHEKALKYGSVVAFFSWIPFIGDPLLFALGFYKSPFFKSMLFMTLGKTLRYGSLLFLGL